jgi:hypothetical protein
MNICVAGLLAALSCNTPALGFRDFYAACYYDGSQGTHWAGRSTETTEVVLKRLVDAQADFIDYRVTRMEICK